MLILPSKSQRGTCAVLKLPELVECDRCIGEQVGLPLGVFGDLDSSIVNPIVDPVWGEVQGLGDLRHRQVAGDAARVRLMLLLEEAMLEADGPDRAGQHLLAHG